MTRSWTFAAAAEAALAWCLREAATNVIRHSGAQHCRIRLTERRHELALEVSDDGRGVAADGNATGSGLHNMSERLSAVGGRFSAGPGRDGHGFRLVATIPLTSDEPAATVPIPPTATSVDANVRT
jgi:two-component system sensor histidine kinase DesK